VTLFIGFYAFHVKIEYLVVFMAALIVAQAIDIDHTGKFDDKVKCATSVAEKDCDNPMSRGVFHDLTLYWFMKALVAGLFIGWNIHLRMDGLL
jgi:hypothetical protein